MNLIEYDGGTLTSLRQRVAEVEEINEDLVAFARGQSSAVAAIHEAVLAALSACSPEALGLVVTCRWPMLLKVDEAALCWSDGAAAFHADAQGFRAVEPRLVARMADHIRPVTMRAVGRGHPVFGAQAAEMRSEALIRLDGVAGCGVIALGQRQAPAAEGLHGARLLRFLGRSVSHMLERWPAR